MSGQVFTLPDLGEGLTEAELVRWLVAVGDAVAVDAPVAEVETAKATVEVPSPFGGVITELHGAEGATLAVGAPLITVSSGAAGSYVEEERAGSGNVLIGYGTSEAPPSRRRRTAARAAASATTAAPVTAATPATTAAPESAPEMPPVPASVVASRSGDRPAVASPVVRRLARDSGIAVEELAGTGPDGLVTRADVQAAIAAATTGAATVGTVAAGKAAAGESAAASEATAGDRRTGLPIRTRVPITGLRRAVAETLGRSRTEIPEATTWVDVDATALLALRDTLPDRPGILAVVARFVVAGLARFPELNARVDTGRGEILHLDGVNLGIAAQTERGLVVPAVAGAHRLGMRGLDAEIRRLTLAARAGTATAAELGSGSFTLNNYGVLGVDGSAAIINHPEVAILGMGRILPRPWVVDGEIVARHIVQLSLVFDHRVCDGGTAGGFLRFVADCVESPTSAMADL
ncbi:dihydrolipoamide acetyltransferase family protein [Pseudonocardia sp. HH130630-07]|uniref:dihydrolipoamide acetyltransferase family protein n=1 Tax=Pseudonocardia sp. HH130630-07 TaxID=1690815 RepID=UPI000814D1A8|nr:dihydrolipoamide acetyltransferase family protein [Pseudonocardia sp. HH130630-07]ANY08470.1 branched-chain alpha-keto acid dehydrogenase subunit E2 [Pseudonocardia sp. HH130630-07]